MIKVLEFHSEKECKEALASLETKDNEVVVSNGMKIAIFQKPSFWKYALTANELRKEGFVAESSTESDNGECCYCGWQYSIQDSILTVNGVAVCKDYYNEGRGCDCSG